MAETTRPAPTAGPDRADPEGHALNRQLRTPPDRYGQRLGTTLSAEALQQNVMAAETASLAGTFAALARTGSVPRAAQLLLGSRRRFVMGEGKSAAYAALLNADLAATLSNVFLVDGHALAPLTVLSDVRASDVLVLFSLRRYRRETIALGRLFRRAGGHLVVVTDSPEAPAARDASVLIVVDTGSASYADSPTAVAAVCQLLSALTAAASKGSARRLRRRDVLTSRLALYDDPSPDDPPRDDPETTAEEER